MGELVIIRHAQASFGSDNYDQLSDLGHTQSRMAGAALSDMGWVPDRLVTGTLTRHHETLASMGFDADPEQHPGFNEYDFHDLLHTRFGGKAPDDVMGDRKTHFRTLRDTILEWQKDAIKGVRETWSEFEARTAAALAFATETEAKRVLVVSSGGVIGQLVASVLNAPGRTMMELNLQAKNTGLTRFIFSRGRLFLHEFNATPHFAPTDKAQYLTYS